MNIPEPKFEFVRYGMAGLSWWKQIWRGWITPPRIKLVEDWTIELEGGLLIVVPKGFITDCASIPRILWAVMSPFGPLRNGAILHDFGYQHGYLLAYHSLSQPFNLASLKLRSEYPWLFCDLIPVYVGNSQQFFDDLMRYISIESEGVTVQANIAYGMLRMSGWFAWNKYRKAGPAAYNSNSLGLVGVDVNGAVIK